MLGITLLLFWATTLVNCFGMRTSSIVSGIGAILGTIIPMLFIIILGIVWVVLGHHSQISFNLQSFIPDTNSLENIGFFTAVLFGLMGLEMSAIHAGEVKNPKQDYPKALLISVLLIFITLVLSSLAIAVIVPHNDIKLVTGLVAAFKIFFYNFNLNWMLPVMVSLIIVGSLCNVSTWIIGPTKGLLVASRDGCIPPIFCKVSNAGVPYVLLITQGIIFTCSAQSQTSCMCGRGYRSRSISHVGM